MHNGVHSAKKKDKLETPVGKYVKFEINQCCLNKS